MELNKTRIELGNTKTNVKDLTTKLDGKFETKPAYNLRGGHTMGSSHETRISISLIQDLFWHN
jgi:hypothetical protein